MYLYNILQENVGGTTYFYQASGNDNISHNSTDGSLHHVSHLGHSSGGASPFQVYPGTPSHLVNLRPSKNASTSLSSSSSSFFISEDMRAEILNKNSLTLMQPDPEHFPGALLFKFK